MKELPILFSTDMVQAILAERKSQTRRTTNLGTINRNASAKYWQGARVSRYINSGDKCFVVFKTDIGPSDNTFQCPYGQVGSLLWVRETWQYNYNMVNETMLHEPTLNNIVFKADNPQTSVMLSEVWKPSIHLKKEHARIWLEVTSIRVECLQQITEENAKAEGVELHHRGERWLNYMDRKARVTQFIFNCSTALSSFESLWEMINGHHSWHANPWVWVIEFKVLSTTGRPA